MCISLKLNMSFDIRSIFMIFLDTFYIFILCYFFKSFCVDGQLQSKPHAREKNKWVEIRLFLSSTGSLGNVLKNYNFL